MKKLTATQKLKSIKSYLTDWQSSITERRGDIAEGYFLKEITEDDFNQLMGLTYNESDIIIELRDIILKD